MTKPDQRDVSEDDTVTVEFASALNSPFPVHQGRMTIRTRVSEVRGDFVHLDNPFGEPYPVLVLDAEGYLWARSERGKRGLFGKHATIE